MGWLKQWIRRLVESPTERELRSIVEGYRQKHAELRWANETRRKRAVLGEAEIDRLREDVEKLRKENYELRFLAQKAVEGAELAESIANDNARLAKRLRDTEERNEKLEKTAYIHGG